VLHDAFEDRNRLRGLAAAHQRDREIEIGIEIAAARDLVLRNRGAQFLVGRHRVLPAILRRLGHGNALIGFGMQSGIDAAALVDIERNLRKPLRVLRASLRLQNIRQDENRMRGLRPVNALQLEEVDQRAAHLQLGLDQLALAIERMRQHEPGLRNVALRRTGRLRAGCAVLVLAKFLIRFHRVAIALLGFAEIAGRKGDLTQPGFHGCRQYWPQWPRELVLPVQRTDLLNARNDAARSVDVTGAKPYADNPHVGRQRGRRHRHHDRGAHFLPDRCGRLEVAGIGFGGHQRYHDTDGALRFGWNLLLESGFRFFRRLRHEIEVGLAGHSSAGAARSPWPAGAAAALHSHPHGASRALRARHTVTSAQGPRPGPAPPGPGPPPAAARRAARLALTKA